MRLKRRTRKRRRLYGVQVDELSLVDDPAVPKSRFLIAKRRQEEGDRSSAEAAIAKSLAFLFREHENLNPAERLVLAGMIEVSAMHEGDESEEILKAIRDEIFEIDPEEDLAVDHIEAIAKALLPSEEEEEEEEEAFGDAPEEEEEEGEEEEEEASGEEEEEAPAGASEKEEEEEEVDKGCGDCDGDCPKCKEKKVTKEKSLSERVALKLKEEKIQKSREDRLAKIQSLMDGLASQIDHISKVTEKAHAKLGRTARPKTR